MLQAIRVLAIAAIFWAARGLYVGGAPRLWTERAQECGRVRGTGAHLHVVRLQQGAALLIPVLLELEDDFLKGDH